MSGEWTELQKKHVFFTWSNQATAQGLEIVHAEGATFHTADGQRWIDFESQVYNAHLGHGNRRVIRAIQEQAEKLCVAHPAAIYEAKARLGEKLSRITPGTIEKFFFTLGGAEANENALKMARQITGRHKVISRYNSYHGATYGALSLTGDARRIPFEPGIPGVVRVSPPDCHRCPWGQHPANCSQACIDDLIRIAEFEDPKTIAAVFVEPIGGAVGGYMPPPAYLQKLRAFCTEHGILLIADEVLTGFGRTGKWFAVDHSGVAPDMIILAKGLTAGYSPLGAVGVSSALAKYYDEHFLWGGLTGYAHPLACAAALATIEEMESENLVERSARLGSRMSERIARWSVDFEGVSEARAMGLYAVIEFCQPGSRTVPLVPEGASGSAAAPLDGVRRELKSRGIHMAVKGPRAFIAPPLTIREEVLLEGLDAVEKAIRVGLEGE